MRNQRKQRLRAIALGAFATLLLLVPFCYFGVGPRQPGWNDPLVYPNRDANAAYRPEQFTSAAVCGTCHQRHYAEWRSSAMGRSAGLSFFLIDLYELSLDVRGAPREDVVQCLQCHAPLATTGDAPDIALERTLSQEGVNCDVCHTAVESHANDAPAMMVWDPTGPKRGPLPGTNDPPEAGVPTAISSVHGTAKSRVVSSSELCGACHMSAWPTNALPIDWTYAEWKASPYAAKGVTCQDCHMPTYRGVSAPGAPEREQHAHTFPGGSDLELVRKTATLDIRVHTLFVGHEVVVRVENTGAGHAFPTGNATAPVVRLLVHGYDSGGHEVFAGQREYRLRYVDGQGKITNDPSIAVALASDTTLQALEPRYERFYLARELGATRVEAELVYRRWNEDIVENHAGILYEFLSRYLRNGFRLHRLLARLGDLDFDKLERVRSFEPMVVATASMELAEMDVAPTTAQAP